MKQIAIFGAGGLGREIAMLIEQINAVNPCWDLIGFFDDGKEIGASINGYKTLGGLKEVNAFQEELFIVSGLGDPSTKQKVFSKITNPNTKYPVLIHPGVQISSKYVSIGEGTVITAGNILTVNIHIGKHVLLNLGCTVGHDAVINDYCSFMPSVNISGEVNIGEGVYVGTGAKIINQVEIGKNTIIGAGAVVSKSIPENCTAVGIPAKPIKFHQ